MTKLLGNHKIQKQVDALLSVMTLEQKIGQMTQPDRMTCSPQQAKQHHIGSILSSSGSSPKHNRPADWVAMNDAYWQASTAQDQNHLPIPLLYGLDAIHGNNNVRGATIFPHNIGLGAAHDSQLLKQIAKITALEVLASGVDWVFAPNLAVAADQHWGRTYESYSSDPRLVTRYAGQIIQGLQGKFGAHNVLACAKHWVGDGGTQYGVDQGDTLLSWQQLQDQHIAPYFEALKAGALSIMVSFSSWNGDKCHANKFLLIDTLKQQMNFQGMLVSDMQGIDYLADDFYLAVAHGVNAGIDMFMGPQNWQQFIEYLSSHVELGTVPIERINDAVRRILSVKFAIGLFDKGRPSERKWSDHSSFGSLSHRRVARRAVRKSLVLLKNSHSLLPLKKHSNILVAGKNAHNLGHQCGGFTIAWQGVSGNQAIAGGTSIWQGIKNTAINAQLSHDGTGVEADPQLHDVAIVVIGETPYAEGAGDIRQHDHIITQAGAQINGQVKVIQAYGHSLELSQLHPEDIKTINTIADQGIPVVTILISGRPLIIDPELARSEVFIAAWLPGSEGQGISDLLFGDRNFKGKLSFEWPKKASAKTDASSQETEVLFPIGFGLKY